MWLPNVLHNVIVEVTKLLTDVAYVVCEYDVEFQMDAISVKWLNPLYKASGVDAMRYLLLKYEYDNNSSLSMNDMSVYRAVNLPGTLSLQENWVCHAKDIPHAWMIFEAQGIYDYVTRFVEGLHPPDRVGYDLRDVLVLLQHYRADHTQPSIKKCDVLKMTGPSIDMIAKKRKRSTAL